MNYDYFCNNTINIFNFQMHLLVCFRSDDAICMYPNVACRMFFTYHFADIKDISIRVLQAPYSTVL